MQIKIGEKTFNFRVEYIDDTDNGAPWENSDGQGVVSGWTTRPKRAGELELNRQGASRRYFDFSATCKKAREEQWDAPPYNTGGETKRQQAAKAARANYEYIRAWCKDEWRYVGVVVTLLDDNGDATGVTDTLWGVETYGDYHEIEAARLVDELAHGYGVSWGEITSTTYGAW